jgi:hypothetical protein
MLAKENIPTLSGMAAPEATRFLSTGIGVELSQYAAKEACQEAGVELRSRSTGGSNQFTQRRNIADLAAAVEAMYRRIEHLEKAWGDKSCRATETDAMHLAIVKSLARQGNQRETQGELYDGDDRN